MVSRNKFRPWNTGCPGASLGGTVKGHRSGHEAGEPEAELSPEQEPCAELGGLVPGRAAARTQPWGGTRTGCIQRTGTSHRSFLERCSRAGTCCEAQEGPYRWRPPETASGKRQPDARPGGMLRPVLRRGRVGRGLCPVGGGGLWAQTARHAVGWATDSGEEGGRAVGMLLHQVGKGRRPGVFEKGSDVHWAVNREKSSVCSGLRSGKRSHQETGWGPKAWLRVVVRS